MKSILKKRGSTLALRAIILFIGSLGLIFSCILIYNIAREDDIEYIAILFVMLLSTIPVFIAIFHTIKILNYIDTNTAFSDLSVKSLKNIKYCGIIFSVLFTVILPVFYYAAESEDAPGLFLIGLVITFAGVVVSTFAAVCERILEDAIAIKSENDLTL